VFHLDRAFKLRKLDPAMGATLAISAAPIANANGSAPHLAIDPSGKVFASNGGFNNGRLYAFDPDLTLRWSLAVSNVNQGGPALGADGTLVIAGVGANVFALRSDCHVPAASVVRNAGTNPQSLASNLPILGSTWTATVDLTTTGHANAFLFGALQATDVPLGGGRHLLCGSSSAGLVYQATRPGPLATFTIAIPLDPTLCGRTFCMQAAHIGGAPFVLSNALDLTLGG
jgi:hypothetical protein